MRRWTPEERQKQADAIKKWKPWEKSTGPNTQAGKARAKMNGLKHGRRSAAYRARKAEESARWSAIWALVHKHKRFLATVPHLRETGIDPGLGAEATLFCSRLSALVGIKNHDSG